MNKERKIFLIFLLFLILYYLFVYRNVIGIGLFYPSNLIIPISSTNQLSSYVWNAFGFTGFGGPTGWNEFYLIQGLLSVLLGSPSLVQKITYFSVLPLSGITAYYSFGRMGFSPARRTLVSILYMLNPWVILEFMTGQYVIWFYPLLPIAALIVWRSTEHKLRIYEFAILTIVSAITTAVSLQALIVDVFLLIPIFSRLNLKQGIKTVATNFALLVASLVIGVLLNLSSLSTYYSFFTYVNSTSYVSDLAAYFVSPLGLYERGFLILLSLSLLTIFLLNYRTNVSRERRVIFSATLISLLFTILYVNANTSAGWYLISRTAILSPFDNFDKFMLISWTLFLIASAFIIKDIPLSPAYLKKTQDRGANRPQPPKGSKGVRRIVASYAFVIGLVAILLMTSLTFTLPTYSEGGTLSLLEGNFPASFTGATVPSYYNIYQDFLAAKGVSFDYSYHDMVLPMCVGYTNSYFLGEAMLPGFVGLFGQNVAYAMLNTLEQDNQTNFLTLLSLLGIKYIAVIPPLAGAIFEAQLNSSPNIVGPWLGGYFPTGNWETFDKIFSSWSLMKVEFKWKNMTVYENTLANSPVLASNETNLLRNILAGNYISNYIVNPSTFRVGEWSNRTLLLGGNLAVIGYNHIGEGYSMYTNNKSLVSVSYSNGSINMKILNGSNGVELSQPLSLQPNATYMIAYNYTQVSYNKLFPQYPVYRTAAGVFWNKGTGANITGAANYPSSLNQTGNSSGTEEYIFRTPAYNGPIPAVLDFFASPPINNSRPNYVNFSGIKFYEVKDLKPKFNYVEQLRFEDYGDTIILPTIPNHSKYVSLDVSFSTEWRAVTNNGITLEPKENAAGNLEFNITGTNATSLKIFYLSSDSFMDLTWFEIVGYLFMSLLIVAAFIYTRRIS